MQSFSLSSFAKINLVLKVLGKRDDGFHELETFFQTVSLADEITFSPSEKREILLTSDAPHIPTDETNLIVRAAFMLREKFGIDQGAKIHLEKKIPAPGGLGGGSSNAAIALVGLAALWDIETNSAILQEIGAKLGADVPFFFYGGTAFGTGLGTEIRPMPDFGEKYMIIITPNVKVSTKEAYQNLNALPLTKTAENLNLKVSCSEAELAKRLRAGLQNDFEPTIFRAYPEIERAKLKLLNLGAKNALMSGSGASVFGIFDNVKARNSAFQALQNETNWLSFEVETISRGNYRRELAQCASFLDDSA